MSAVDAFREAAAAHQRCFWLDGGGAREWSGHRSLIGILEPDDVSLTYSAATREVTRHVDGESEVVGSDVFAVLEDELALGSHRDQWFGYFGYACRPDLPALVGPDGVPDAVWMRPSHVRLFDHARAQGSPGTRGNLTISAEISAQIVRDPRVPGETGSPAAAYAEAFAQVQEQLHAGNSYEVNLTYRLDAESDLDPVAAYLRLRELNPAPYAGFLQHDVDGARGWLLSSSPERYALVTRDDDGRPHDRDQADQGHHPARRHARGGRGAAALARDRAAVPRREPDDHRPAPQRPGHGLRGRHRRGAGAAGGRVLPHRAPAGLDGPRPAARRRHHGRRAARAVPGGLDDRRAQAAHDGGDHRRRGHRAGGVRRRVRLARRRRPRRPRRGHPDAHHDRRRRLPARHRRRDHRALRRRERVRRVAVEGRAAAARPVAVRPARNTVATCEP